jgi:hypothetical protein
MSTFVEFTKPYMAPAGGMIGSGEIVGFDPLTAANLIATGVAVSSSAPGVVTPISPVRVKFTATTMVGNSPPLYDVGEVASFPPAISAALVAQGVAVLN